MEISLITLRLKSTLNFTYHLEFNISDLFILKSDVLSYNILQFIPTVLFTFNLHVQTLCLLTLYLHVHTLYIHWPTGCRVTMLQQHHYRGEQLDPNLCALVSTLHIPIFSCLVFSRPIFSIIDLSPYLSHFISLSLSTPLLSGPYKASTTGWILCCWTAWSRNETRGNCTKKLPFKLRYVSGISECTILRWPVLNFSLHCSAIFRVVRCCTVLYCDGFYLIWLYCTVLHGA